MKRYLSGTLIFLALFIIIGVVMGSSREGRYMIENANIGETASQLKTIEQAVNSFYNKYGFLPGDLSEPSKIISECVNLNCPSGDGNSLIDEPDGFWSQLYASKFLPDVIVSKNGLGGYTTPFYHAGKDALPFVNDDSNSVEGHYLVLLKSNKIDKDAYFLSAQQAARIDRKLDDGVPDTGAIIAATTGQCTKLNDEGKLIYNEEYIKPCAFLYFRMNLPELYNKNKDGSPH